MAFVDLKLQIEGINPDTDEASDFFRALEGVPFNQQVLNAMTRVAFHAVAERGDQAIREELRETSISFYAKRAEEIDAEEAAA